jgi:hypothetical protein
MAKAKIKGFFKRLVDSIDKKLKEKSKKSGCKCCK